MVEDTEVAFVEVMEGVGWDTLFETDATPPRARPAGQGALLPIGVAPGLARWNVFEYGPELEIPVHQTDTLDFDVVLTGTVELILDDGTYSLVPGDCVVVAGVDHAWRAGPEGCRLSVIFLGTPPPS